MMIHGLIILLQIIACFTVAASAGPDKFRFTKEPLSQSIASGGSVSLTCIATGRTESAITYQWYQSAGVTIPPVDGDKLDATGHANGVGSVLTKTLTDGETKLLFQCKAIHDSEYILSNVAKVSYTFQGITFDKSSPDLTVDVTSGPVSHIMASLECHADIDTDLRSAAPVEIKWYKGTGSTAVSDARMWVSPATSDGSDISITVLLVPTQIKKYSLVIFNVESGDAGDYECRAVSTDGTSKVIRKVALTVDGDPSSTTDYVISEPLVGIRIQQLNSDNTLKTTPNVGDNVTLICGGIGMNSGDSTLTYKWEISGSTVSTTRFHVISSVAKSDAKTYTCTVYNSGSKSSSKDLTLTVQDAVTTVVFGFTEVPDQYIWWVNGETNGDITFNCTGGDGTDASYTRNFYRNGVLYTQVGSDAKYTNPIKNSADSGAIQCAYSRSTNDMWLQQTTELLIVTKASAVFSTTSQTIQDGSTASVTCKVGGYPVPHEVKMSHHAGNDITCPTTDSQSTTSNGVKCTRNSKTQYVVSVENFALANQGSYSCTAKNQFYKTDTTPTVCTSTVPTTTFVYVKNSVTRVAASSTKVNLGDGLTITCTVEGWPEPTVKLEKDGVAKTDNISTTGTNTKVLTYTVASTAHTDSGTYKCLGSNTVNSIEQGSQAEIIVAVVENVRVTLSKTPSADEIAPGQALTLTCVAKAGPKPDYLLFKNTTNDIVEYNNAATAGVVVTDNGLSYTHTIASPALGDSTTYTCIANNTDTDGTENTDQKTSKVIIVQDVVVKVSATGHAPQRGSTYLITCTAEGGRDPHSVVLTHASTALKSYPTDDWCTGSYRKTCVHTISNIDYSAEGTYTCTAKNNASGNNEVTKSDTSASVVVLKTVTVTFAADETEVDYGAQHTVTCTVEGGKAPHKVTLESPSDQMYTWEKNAGSNTLSCTGTNILSCTHTIDKALYSAGGDYNCTGWNKDDADTEASAHKTTAVVIVENVKVTLSKTPSADEIAPGQALTLTCAAKAGPKPDYLLFKNTNNDIKEYNNAATTGVVVTDNGLSYTHTIARTALGDSTIYTCIANNTDTDGTENTDKKTSEVIIVQDVVVKVSASVYTPQRGTTYVITCTAEGGRDPHSVVLTHSSTALKSYPTDDWCTGSYRKTCVHTISNIDYSAEGTYTCTAKNRASGDNEVTKSATSASVVVLKTVTITFAADETEVDYGASHTVTCTVEGGKAPHKVTLESPSDQVYTWEENAGSNTLSCTGTNILSCTHTIAEALYSAGGDYSCTGWNKDDADTEASAHKTTAVVIVKNAVTTVTKTPTTLEVLHGSQLTINCTIEGGRRPDYLKLNSTTATIVEFTSANITSVTSKTDNSVTYLYQQTAKYTDTSTYTCLGKNKAKGGVEREDSKTIKVIVVKPIVVSFESSLHNKSKGEVFTLTCTARGYRQPHMMKLEKKNDASFDLVKEWDINTCTKTGDQTVKCTYTFASLDYTDKGRYKCTGQNKVVNNETSTSTVETNVQVYQDIAVSFKDLASGTEVEVELGASFTVTCLVDGGLPPHQVDIVTTKDGTKTWNNPSQSGDSLNCTGDNSLTCTMLITASYDTSGIYTCTGHNKDIASALKTNSDNFTLTTVKDVSVILTKNPSEEKVFKGELVSFTCVAEGGRKPHELQFDQNETMKFKYPDNSTGMDTSGANNLTYTDTAIASADYSDSATYKCTSKNRAAGDAAGNTSKDASDSKMLTVVKNATINAYTLSDSDIDYGKAVAFNFNVEGGAVPDVVKIVHSGSPIFDISTSEDKCSGTNVITCKHSITKVDYSHDGDYILKVKNVAKARASTEATRTVTIIKDVNVTITPPSATNITYGSSYTITCTLDGGMRPHKVEFNITTASGTETKLWKRDGSSNNLSCDGDHNVTCSYTFNPGYDSDGQYKCTGYNKVRSDAVRSAEENVTLTTVRVSTVLTITPDKTSALADEAVTIVCTIAGKPRPANATISWTHSGGYDISSNYTTVATGPYDLTSTLALTKLDPKLSGVFTCKVGSSQMSTEQISIAQNNFLNPPALISNLTSSAVAIEVEESDYIQLICEVVGFPAKTASLIVKNGEEEVIHEEKGKDKDDGDQSVEEIKGSFVWVRKVSCSDTIYLCRVTNTLITIDTEMSVIVDGCGIPMAIIGGAGGGAAALIIIVIVLVVLCIVRARKSNKGSFTPTSGAVIENGTYRSDTAPDPTYDHISQPVDADNGAYATFDDAKLKLKKPESEYAYATSTRLARPPPGFNGKNQYDQLQQQPVNSPPSDSYAKLERDGTVPKGVISRYRPLNFDKGKQAPPQLPGNMPKEMSMKRNDDIEMDPMYAQIEKKQIEPDPMYAQLETKPKRGKQKVLQPDLPPDVPFYASRDEVQNEGLYASLDQSSKKKRGHPPPPNDDLPPEVPIYSTRDEEDLYASVGPKASSSLRHPEPVYDDRPPDVPLYESRDEIEEESPYAAVEFKPKNGSTYRPYIPPDDATLYSTINEIQTSEEDHYVNARDVSRT